MQCTVHHAPCTMHHAPCTMQCNGAPRNAAAQRGWAGTEAALRAAAAGTRAHAGTHSRARRQWRRRCRRPRRMIRRGRAAPPAGDTWVGSLSPMCLQGLYTHQGSTSHRVLHAQYDRSSTRTGLQIPSLVGLLGWYCVHGLGTARRVHEAHACSTARGASHSRSTGPGPSSASTLRNTAARCGARSRPPPKLAAPPPPPPPPGAAPAPASISPPTRCISPLTQGSASRAPSCSRNHAVRCGASCLPPPAAAPDATASPPRGASGGRAEGGSPAAIATSRSACPVGRQRNAADYGSYYGLVAARHAGNGNGRRWRACGVRRAARARSSRRLYIYVPSGQGRQAVAAAGTRVRPTAAPRRAAAAAGVTLRAAAA